jgi:hypothetical protein
VLIASWVGSEKTHPASVRRLKAAGAFLLSLAAKPHSSEMEPASAAMRNFMQGRAELPLAK